MEEDVLQFLVSRQIPKEDLMRMQRDKIDKAVLSVMTDEQMAKYLPSYGDRVATLSFCGQTNSSTSTDKDILLQRLKEKIGTRKIKSKTKRALTDTLNAPQTQKYMIRQENSSAEKTTRKIEVGWLHFSNNEYHQVRTRNGGGTRHTSVDKTITVAQILEIGKGLFFPNGNSTKGPVEDFTFTICDFKRNQIPLEVTVGNMYEQTKLRLLRFYICSKEAPSEDESSSEVNEDSFSEVFSEELESMSTVHGAHSDVNDPITDVLELTLSSDSDSGEQIVDFPVLHPVSRKQRTSKTVASQGPERLHHPCSTPTHSSHGQETYLSARDERPDDFPVIFETSDLTIFPKGPNHGYPESLGVLGIDDTVVWDPEDQTSRAGGDDTVVITLNRVQEEDVTQGSKLGELPVQGLHFQQSDDLHTVHTQSTEEESIQNVQDNGQLSGPHDLPLQSSNQLSPSTTADNLGHSESSQCISVRRIKVVDDLLAVFMDSKIMNVNLKMVIVNEKAVDDAGVSREIYTAFWEQFLEYCEGEDERVPRLRPDFWDSEWQAVGMIWVKGLLDHGVIPVRLCKAFILACIHGIDYVDKDILMSSFLNYLPLVERSAVESALRGIMDDSNEEDLMDLFTRMGSHSLPQKSNFNAAIETMAHKAILQEPKYVIDCFAIPMAEVQQKLSDKTSVLFLYDSKQPTGKRVAQLLETTNIMLSQREQSTFNHLQRYIKNADQTKAGKILRFCTGSSVICVNKIIVCFNVETGLNRRPIGHTCGATLEVPCTYSSYPEFRSEFDNMLSSDYFEMDIL